MMGKRKRVSRKDEWTALDDIALFDAIAKHKPTGKDSPVQEQSLSLHEM